MELRALNSRDAPLKPTTAHTRAGPSAHFHVRSAQDAPHEERVKWQRRRRRPDHSGGALTSNVANTQRPVHSKACACPHAGVRAPLHN
eukprot:scaffold98413_cov37-Tisochrysis_lutea.AAC.1